MNIPNNILAVLARTGVLKHLNLQWQGKVDHTPAVIPILGHWGLSNLWLSELWMIPVLNALRTVKNGLFVDIGVNQGQTLLKVKSIDAQTVYFGFEPDPRCTSYVLELIRANRFTNCAVVPVGLSDKTGLATLFSSGDGDPSASILESFRTLPPDVARQPVPVFRFDALVEPLMIRDLAVMKIDVEGSELEVLRGAQQAIASFRPFIICEILPVYDDTTPIGRTRKERQETIESMLRDLNYQIYRINHTSGRFHEINQIGIHSDLEYCDYVCVPREAIFDISRFLL